MRYLALSEDDRKEMLAAIGASDLRNLFADAPKDKLLAPGSLRLPPAHSEAKIRRLFEQAAGENRALIGNWACFLGAGVYAHHRPAAIDHLLMRSEFFTAYTPYQPEISQGTLQALFEFQTMVARLLAMDVANGSVYDAATAVAEAALMALRLRRGKKRIVVAESLHPRWQAVLATYLRHAPAKLEVAPRAGYGTDPARICDAIDDETAAVIVQFPDAFGALWDLAPVRRRCDETKTLLIVAFADPILFARLAPPGEWGADIAAGSGQALGVAMSFGGPSLGLLATKKAFVRQMPGRLCGLTQDEEGRRGFVLTLVAREQHIRRAKATSNICSNQQLLALAAVIYASLLGEAGMRQIADRSMAALQRLVRELPAGVEAAEGARAHETVVLFPTEQARQAMLEAGRRRHLLAGVPLERLYPEDPNAHRALLVATTECIDEEAIGRWLDAAKEALR